MTMIKMMMVVIMVVVVVIVMRIFTLKVIMITEIALMCRGESRNHLGEQRKNGVHGSGRQRDPGPG